MVDNPINDVAQDAIVRLASALEELKVGDRVTYDGRPGTVTELGCKRCSGVVVTSDDGRTFMPGSTYKLKRFMEHMDGVMREAVRKSEQAEFQRALDAASGIDERSLKAKA